LVSKVTSASARHLPFNWSGRERDAVWARTSREIGELQVATAYFPKTVPAWVPLFQDHCSTGLMSVEPAWKDERSPRSALGIQRQVRDPTYRGRVVHAGARFVPPVRWHGRIGRPLRCPCRRRQLLLGFDCDRVIRVVSSFNVPAGIRDRRGRSRPDVSGHDPFPALEMPDPPRIVKFAAFKIHWRGLEYARTACDRKMASTTRKMVWKRRQSPTGRNNACSTALTAIILT